ncbi:transcription termination factor NusA [Desulfobulbus alkaliphilus]|uniref:transcription termination factor NusA n=1 Tax=Desulfobulbus alkaliphilus TaxID=869814 RepID=UPI001962E51A|nr:transcription termination factor NusA [Desulfobulbus alkaliphilus]MBM9536882.1 transcription termination/antitermination protein NusA [Desulfobulbus alkaliphilus]
MVGTENLKRIIDQICRDKGIDRTLLIDAIEEAVRSAVRKKYGTRREIEVQFNEELGEVEIFQYRTVVDEVFDEETEISLDEARRLDPEVELDDDLGEKMNTIADLGRIAAQSAKQVIIHRMRDAERDVIFEMFRDREGNIVNGIVQRFERGDMIINLGRTDALLPRDGQIPKRSYKQGDRIRAYLLDVRRDVREGRFRDSQLILSRTCNEFLEKLFEMEVPEIAEGIVKIMRVSREPGFRAKIAVSSIESDVDPVGACVGLKGSRVQNVVQELQGERIDIVPWSPDPAKYVCNALAPAEVSMVIVDDDRKSLQVVVPDDQLSLAIGRQGQNVRLASRLLGWKIDVKSEQRYHNLENSGYRGLTSIEGMDEGLADRLFAAGITSPAMLAAMNVDELMLQVRIDQDNAVNLLEKAGMIAAPEDEPNQGTTEESLLDQKGESPESEGQQYTDDSAAAPSKAAEQNVEGDRE